MFVGIFKELAQYAISAYGLGQVWAACGPDGMTVRDQCTLIDHEQMQAAKADDAEEAYQTQALLAVDVEYHTVADYADAYPCDVDCICGLGAAPVTGFAHGRASYDAPLFMTAAPARPADLLAVPEPTGTVEGSCLDYLIVAPNLDPRLGLKGLFSQFGEVAACWLPPLDKRGKEPAYVKFSRPDAAQAALQDGGGEACNDSLIYLDGVRLNAAFRSMPTRTQDDSREFDAKGSNLAAPRPRGHGDIHAIMAALALQTRMQLPVLFPAVD
ncbi:unnamed protein product [Prorocentrum cordatum]|uniref:RRM domain-containing protein n=1 Tax=Prorocentrum cordatum TaxID=2364126 RepID=A0ABN9PF74_9DINO|nr:unnamed protein product [Polarella glacialis]